MPLFYEDRKEEGLEKGHHYVEMALDEAVFFIRPDHLVPMSRSGMRMTFRIVVIPILYCRQSSCRDGRE